MAQCTQQNRFVYVDGFSRLFLPNATQTSSVLTLGSQSKWILSIAQIILLALDTLQTEKKSLFIEGLDFVLAAGSENITPLDILTTISVLSEVNPLSEIGLANIVENITDFRVLLCGFPFTRFIAEDSYESESVGAGKVIYTSSTFCY